MPGTPTRPAPSSGDAPDQPFEPAVVERARDLAGRYRIDVREDSHGYVGIVAAMPAVFGCGPSRDAALEQTRELLKWAVAYLIDTGRNPPGPDSAT